MWDVADGDDGSVDDKWLELKERRRVPMSSMMLLVEAERSSRKRRESHKTDKRLATCIETQSNKIT